MLAGSFSRIKGTRRHYCASFLPIGNFAEPAMNSGLTDGSAGILHSYGYRPHSSRNVLANASLFGAIEQRNKEQQDEKTLARNRRRRRPGPRSFCSARKRRAARRTDGAGRGIEYG
jgi:hypothetical protein